ncbi:MAG: hypothetical protein IJ011_05145 [Clostridia bacterium]|nr:hypothetical protein [Clostridia bacterium]
MSSPEVNNTSSPLSDAINKIMANPEIISTVASALGNMNLPKAADQSSDTEKEETEEPKNEPAPETQTAEVSASMPDIGALVQSLAPMMSKLGSSGKDRRGGESCESAKREALLCALKPYLSQGRREAVDYIIRISQISDILKNIQH